MPYKIRISELLTIAIHEIYSLRFRMIKPFPQLANYSFKQPDRIFIV